MVRFSKKHVLVVERLCFNTVSAGCSCAVGASSKSGEWARALQLLAAMLARYRRQTKNGLFYLLGPNV